MKPAEIQESLDLAQTVLGQWVKFRQYYHKAISDQEITPSDEAEFLETKSAIAQNVRKMGQKIDEKRYPFKQKEISEMLKTTVSIHGLRDMPEHDRKTFYKQWHQALIYLTRTMGAFKFLSEGYRPPEAKKGKKGKKGGGKTTIIFAIVGVIVLLAVLYGIAVFMGLA